MQKILPKLGILVIILLFLPLSGCNEVDLGGNDGNGDDLTDCPSPAEVDKLEQDFYQMRDNLSTYMNDTEYVNDNYSTLSQRGVLTDEGRQMRLEYEEFREYFMDVAFMKCENSSGVSLHSGNVVWLKGIDLIKYEIHPEYFLGVPIFSKSRRLYEEPNYWTGETTDYVEYKYAGEIDGANVVAVIQAADVGTVEDQWQWLAREQNFSTAEYAVGEPTGSTIYYTNDYEDEYGWRYKGIYFQIFLFKVYAGYYSWSEYLGTDPDYFDDIVITEQDAKDIYEYLVFRPGYHDLTY